MKRITKIFLALCIVGLGTADASFPVTKEKKSETVSEAPTGSEQTSEQLEALANSAQAQMDEAVDGIENAEVRQKAGGLEHPLYSYLRRMRCMGHR